MCLEPHGSTCEWDGGKLTGASLDAKRGDDSRRVCSRPLGVTANDVTVHCDFIGGGFGTKFSADTVERAAAKLPKFGRPVKLMLDRDLELKTAGSPPRAIST